MADPIRPNLTPFPPQRPQAAAGDAARAAQRAFFAQALNGVQAQATGAIEAAPAPSAEPARQATYVERINIPEEAPQRPTRPGTYLDIKV